MPAKKPPSIPLSLNDRKSQVYIDGLLFAGFMNCEDSKKADNLCKGRCCENYCNISVSVFDIVRLRATFVRALSAVLPGQIPSRRMLLDCITTFLRRRVDDFPVSDISAENDILSVPVDMTVPNNNKVCQRLFIDILCITSNEFRQCLRTILTGEVVGNQRNRMDGFLGDNVCRAIARVAVDINVNGQYNPMNENVLLPRGVNKMEYLETTASRHGSRLTKKHLANYIGRGVSRHAVDSFMRCDVCLTLKGQYRKIDLLFRLATTPKYRRQRSGRGKRTALDVKHAVIAKRKNVLYQVIGKYAIKRKAKAKAEGVTDIDTIPIDSVVPDEDVETARFCEILNDRSKKDGPVEFNITPLDVILSENLDLDAQSAELFLDGELGEDFSVVPDERRDDDDQEENMDGEAVNDQEEVVSIANDVVNEGNMEIDGGHLDEGILNLDGLESSIAKAIVEMRSNGDPGSVRRLCMLSSLQRAMRFRKFHYEHIIAERILMYSTFEMGARNSLSVLSFACDGLSKDTTKLPKPKNMNKEDETVNRLECYVTGLQMSVPRANENIKLTTKEQGERRLVRETASSIRKNPPAFSKAAKLANEIELARFEARDGAAASGFTMVNHDFLYPYGFPGPPNATPGIDATVSNLLHVLASDAVTFLPSAIAIVLDNASVNKSIYTLRAFGLLLELLPHLQEVHLMFPTVGHTHNSVDAHFGTLCRRFRETDIGTPHDLAACMETVPDTHAHIDWGYYVFSKALETVCGTFDVTFIRQQHYFLIYKDNKQDIRFSHHAFLRFAEPISARVNHLLSECRELVPLTPEEKELGAYVFLPGDEGRDAREGLAKAIFPEARDEVVIGGENEELLRQLRHVDLYTPEREADLHKLTVDPSCAGESLYQLCRRISMKAPKTVTSTVEVGSEQEMALAQHIRQLGRKFKSNPLLEEQDNTLLKAKVWLAKNLVDLLLEGDNGTVKSSILNKLKEYASRPRAVDYSYLVNYLEGGVVQNLPTRGDLAGRKRRTNKSSKSERKLKKSRISTLMEDANDDDEEGSQSSLHSLQSTVADGYHSDGGESDEDMEEVTRPLRTVGKRVVKRPDKYAP